MSGDGKGGSCPPSYQDDLQAEATQAAVKELGHMLWSMVETSPNRLVTSLSAQELEWLAVAAICGWIFKRSEQSVTVSRDVEQLIKEVPVQ
jgi:hypothetical protein